MSNPCECCGIKVKFLRQINGNFMHSLVIPEWFVNQFGGKIWGTVRLETSDGNMYHVGVTENMNRTILKSGWTTFVDSNEIEENYSLMFRYLGNALFEVTIFDSNGKEKTWCCSGMRNASGVHKASTSDIDNSSSLLFTTLYLTLVLFFTAEDNLSIDNPLESDDVRDYYVLSGQCDLTEAEELKLHAFVQKIRPKIPVLVVLMKKSNVKPHGDLVIHKHYAHKYLPCKDTNIILQVPRKNKVWECKLHIRPSGSTGAGRRNLSLGDFVGDNLVREGDICLFEPMTNAKQKRFTMTVHLLGKVSIDYSPGRATHIGSNHGRRSTKMGGVKTKPPINGEEYSSQHEEYGVFDDSEKGSEPPFMLPDRSCLTPAQENKVLEKIEDIDSDSELPFYVAIIGKINVCRGNSHYNNPPILNFGFRYAAKYLGKKFAADHHGGKCNAISLVLQREGKSRPWPTKLRYTHIMRASSQQMRIIKGWPSFARDNRLRVGDLCLFKLMENEEQLTMTVYIIRLLGYSDEVQHKIADKLNCKLAVLPISYLVMSLAESRILVSGFDPLVGRVPSRAEPWCGRFTSKGSKTVLISTNLASLPMYMMGMYILPEDVYSSFDKELARPRDRDRLQGYLDALLMSARWLSPRPHDA
ncbi:B3 domain-containing protein [Hordeum vulgare]|nr:B3 domain-containing protein [Hordeum vulgare]